VTSTSVTDEVLYSSTRGVATITINRPEVHNAVTDEHLSAICAHLRDAGADPAVGVVVLTGAGDRAFSSGGDVRWEQKGGAQKLFDGGGPDVHRTMRECLKPVIAAVKGWAIGLGNHLAYSADMTIAADNAVFGQVGPRIGSPADGWTVAYLAQIVGSKKAREMWYMCRRYDAWEAERIGLVNKVVPLADFDTELDRWCQELLAVSPTCLRILKASFEAAFDPMRQPLGHIQHLVAPGFMGSDEQREGAAAFLEKRKPDFRRSSDGRSETKR
jgi:dihydroxynaphthoic acid synthetase